MYSEKGKKDRHTSCRSLFWKRPKENFQESVLFLDPQTLGFVKNTGIVHFMKKLFSLGEGDYTGPENNLSYTKNLVFMQNSGYTYRVYHMRFSRYFGKRGYGDVPQLRVPFLSPPLWGVQAWVTKT